MFWFIFKNSFIFKYFLWKEKQNVFVLTMNDKKNLIRTVTYHNCCYSQNLNLVSWIFHYFSYLLNQWYLEQLLLRLLLVLEGDQSTGNKVLKYGLIKVFLHLIIRSKTCLAQYPNGHAASNRRKFDINFILIRWRPNFDEFARRFHVLFLV